MATMDRERNAEEGEACLGCLSNRRDADVGVNVNVNANDKLGVIRDVNLASVQRKVTFLTCVTAVLCILTLTACGCSLYLYYKMNGMRAEILLAVKAREAEDYAYDPDYLMADQDYQYGLDPPPEGVKDEAASRLRRKKGNKPSKRCKGGKNSRAACKCCVRKVRSLIQSGGISFPTPRPAQTLSTKAPPAIQEQIKDTPIFGAAHYTTAIDNAYIQDHFPRIDQGDPSQTVKCKNVSEWMGRLCRNRTFSAYGAPTTLKMFKEAEWMSNATRIFDLKPDGSFVAKYSGVYLLYAHVLFYDVKTKQAFGLLHESGDGDTNQFRCMESVDHVDPAAGLDRGARYKTCSVSGVLYVAAGDTVKVQLMYAHTDIDLTKDVTYFGGVLFTTR